MSEKPTINGVQVPGNGQTKAPSKNTYDTAKGESKGPGPTPGATHLGDAAAALKAASNIGGQDTAPTDQTGGNPPEEAAKAPEPNPSEPSPVQLLGIPGESPQDRALREYNERRAKGATHLHDPRMKMNSLIHMNAQPDGYDYKVLSLYKFIGGHRHEDRQKLQDHINKGWEEAPKTAENEHIHSMVDSTTATLVRIPTKVLEQIKSEGWDKLRTLGEKAAADGATDMAKDKSGTTGEKVSINTKQTTLGQAVAQMPQTDTKHTPLPDEVIEEIKNFSGNQ